MRRTAPLLVLPAALGVAAYAFGLPLEPDASYYVGGVALFPSPLGTILGTAGGYTGLAVLNAASVLAIVLLVAFVARELDRPPLVAQALALVIVQGEWFIHWGMDAPAAALLLTAALLELRGHSRWALVAAGLGAATHLAALPLALGALVAQRAGWRVVAAASALAAAGAAVASLTAYRAGFQVLHEPRAFVEGARELVLVCWPLLLLSPVATLELRARRMFYGCAAGAIVAGAIPAAVGQLGVTRYAVPCIFIAAPALRFRRLGRVGVRRLARVGST